MASFEYSPSRRDLELASEVQHQQQQPQVHFQQAPQTPQQQVPTTPYAQQQPLVQQYLPPGYVSPVLSPFIPSVNFTPSPMAHAVALPPSPYLSAAPELTDYPVNVNPPQRQRTLSWQGAKGFFQGSSLQPQAAPQFLQATPSGHHRRKSYTSGEARVSPFTGNTPLPTPAQEQIHLNPWLQPRGDIVLDFSSPQFNVGVLITLNGNVIPMTNDAFQEHATLPTVTKMRIVCDLLPNKPFDISSERDSKGVLPAITVGNLLTYIWRVLHSRIAMRDWQTIGMEAEARVSEAYRKRCKSLGALEAAEKQQGVKWVDMLCGKVWFKGLERKGDTFRLIVQ